jgi:hypothetical protein
VARRRSDAYSDQEDEFRAFVFTNNTADDDKVRIALFIPSHQKKEVTHGS